MGSLVPVNSTDYSCVSLAASEQGPDQQDLKHPPDWSSSQHCTAMFQASLLPDPIDELRYFSLPISWRVRFASLDAEMVPGTFPPHAAAAKVGGKAEEGVVTVALASAAPAV